MQLLELYTYLDKHGISVISADMPQSECMSVMVDGDCFIGVDPFALKSSADELVKIAHETGHCETGAFYYGYSPLQLRSQCERRADIWAIKKLIPEDELLTALKKGYTEIWDLAEYFGVTEEFIKKAMEYYKDVC